MGFNMQIILVAKFLIFTIVGFEDYYACLS